MKATLLGLLLSTTAASAFAQHEWRYSVDVDSMNGKKSTFVSTSSDNSLDLGFPYRGKNHGTLTVRQQAVDGLNVLLQIEKGQFVCGVSECRVLVRFDDREPIYFNANEPGDHSSTALFIKPAARFVDQARKAKRIRVQANLFQEGAPVLEFNGPPLEWPWPAAPKSTKR